MMLKNAMESLNPLLQNTSYPEKILQAKGYRHVAGVDEVGRGPLAGPVVAAAVIVAKEWTNPDIKDSKQLTPRKREALYQIIRSEAIAWSWALVEPAEVDQINVLQASLKAMKIAVGKIAVKPDYLLIDGIYPISTSIPQTPIIKGDRRSLPIAAASIMAKVVRDSIMRKYHELYPHYNFAGNKGYGTQEHLRALEQYGHCSIHRKTFKSVIPKCR